MTISTGAAILAGSLGAAGIGAVSSRRAAGAQTDANSAAIAEQRRQFDEILRLTGPQRQVGNQAMNAIAALLGLPGASPQKNNVTQGVAGGRPLVGVRGGGGPRDMNFIRGIATDSGGRTIDGEIIPAGTDFDAAGALENIPGNEVIVNDIMRRIRQSSPTTGGNVLTALADRVGGFQSDRLFGSLFQLAGFGPPATDAAVSGAANSGNAVSNLLQSSGLANASGVMGTGSSVNAGLQNILQFFALQKMLGGGGGTGVSGNPAFGRDALAGMFG